METIEQYFAKLPNFIRWLAFLPLSVITYVMANFLTNIAGKLLEFFSRDPWSDKVYTHLISPGVAGYFSIAIAIAMVPQRKKFVSFLLTAFWLLAYGVLISVALFTDDWKSAIPGVVSAVAAVFSYVHCKERQETSQSNSYSTEEE